jgi:SpoVK/Ycf46/Vps4 family AAA+-type ATPase
MVDNKLIFYDIELEIPRILYSKMCQSNVSGSGVFIIKDNIQLLKLSYFTKKDPNKINYTYINNYIMSTNTIFYNIIKKIETITKIKSLANYNNVCLPYFVKIHYLDKNINPNSLKMIEIYKSKSGLNDFNSQINNDPNNNQINNDQINNDQDLLKIQCSGDFDKNIIDEKFQNFIKYVKKQTFLMSEQNEISIYKIKLKKNIVDVTIDNPEYLEYEEKKNLLSDVPKNENKTENKLENNMLIFETLNILKNPIPPKTITTQKINKEIVVELINKGYKDFDTMYLRENDEKKLKSTLANFQNKKELLKTLGLPNKLCVFLDGKPGTGKSSTILTIASYLKKNIYFLSFSDTLETNDDLQNIFDHVIKNCDCGIIVSEDIDAIGNLVHKRSNFTELNTTNSLESKNEPLNLSYLLNLLQGTLTPDGLIFITTTNHKEKIDEAFYRDGRFDINIEMKLCDHYQLQKIYKKFINRDIPNELLQKIQTDKISPAKFIFSIKDHIGNEMITDEEILQEFINL